MADANRAQFGWYVEQQDDGEATISREEQKFFWKPHLLFYKQLGKEENQDCPNPRAIMS